MINYSVIIPYYNTPKLLYRAINSIPIRQDIEIIIVDNGEIPFIIDNLCNIYNINIYYSDHCLGAGGARNKGIEYATGKWLIFCDSDDFFSNGAFDIFDKYSKDDSDVIYFQADSQNSVTGEKTNRNIYYNTLINQYDGYYDTSNQIRFYHSVPWAKLIKHDLVKQNNLKFEEVQYGNDMFFAVKVGYYARSIKVDKRVVYCVTSSNDSLTTVINPDAIKCRYIEVLKVNLFLRHHNKKEYEYPLLKIFNIARKQGLFFLFTLIKIGIKYKANFFKGVSKIRKIRKTAAFQ